MRWLLLVLSLPTGNATDRMRAWRALRSSGAAVLRDGVYLLPRQESLHALMATIASEVRGSGGNAYVLGVDPFDETDSSFEALFDRSAEFDALVHEVLQVEASLTPESALGTLKLLRKSRKNMGK